MFSKLALLSLASLALADSQSFGLIVIRSGSQYQNTGVNLVDGKFTAKSDSTIAASGVITDDGYFKLVDGSYAVINSDSITTGTEGSKSFSLLNGRFYYNGEANFAIADDGTLSLDNNGLYVLAAYTPSGERAADFTPSGSSNTTSTTASFQTQTTNGANALRGAGFGAAVAAGAALLI